MARVSVYRTYRFIDKDPVIDETRTIVQDVGLMTRLQVVADLSGVGVGTLRNWFTGGTRKPQNATVMAVVTALGYERKFVRSRTLDIDKEREFALAWLKREMAKQQARTPKKKQRA
jgi:hypothetical protein